MGRFDLSPAEQAAIFDVILADRTNGLVTDPVPRFFLNAGQPGSGKTELNIDTQRRFGDNLLECNADTLRDYHPDAARLLREHELEYPAITWPAASAWNQALRDEAIERRLHLLIETTLRDASEALQTLERMKGVGYTTNLQVLAVPPFWSWLGVHTRFESSKASKGWGRIVPDDLHDQRVDSLRANLPIVLSSPHLDFVSIYQRRLMVPPGATTALELATADRNEALNIFYSIQEGLMNAAEKSEFEKGCDKVLGWMRDRAAPTAIIHSFERRADQIINRD